MTEEYEQRELRREKGRGDDSDIVAALLLLALAIVVVSRYLP